MKGIIFDMDGVILDTETISFRTWEIASVEFGVSDINVANKRCMGANRRDTYELLREIYGRTFPSEKFLERTSELFDQIAASEGISLMMYAKDALEILSEKYKIALATSTRRFRAVSQLKNAGIFDFFITKTFGDDVVHSKPDPEIYLTACNSLSLSPEECFAVEDSFNGIKSASSAGLKTIMIPDKVEPTAEIKKLCYKVLPNLKEFTDFAINV